ncbi:uncharacterized protein J4E88_001611 [Alternaria novae-zelandiae]|uniref:uncharacterized protein n=1 Tax=Alternaria novae-zelandiae TaxID=430562 RepID=UPI0020C59D4B|nr:uncharacterized protein J4E88_001611 [Alternaria novae-zelandiae]KAI4693240.1 hypothetical protein J4E88_001611 [Alternaria novae-zelandiae]KAI4700922.1 hypothetical protein J4E81_003886 [Alternaria sp. BMP 2799]
MNSSKWAPGGANSENEPDPPAPPANAPTGPRDTQSRDRRNESGRGRQGRGRGSNRTERTNNRGGHNSGAAGPAPDRSPSINDGLSPFGRMGLNSAIGRQPSGEDFNGRLTAGVHGNTTNQPRPSAVFPPGLSIAQDERSQRDADQAIDEFPGLGADRQAGRAGDEASRMSLPTRSSPSISSSRDPFRHAAQNQAGQLNHMTATPKPARSVRAIQIKNTDGEVVAFQPISATGKMENQKGHGLNPSRSTSKDHDTGVGPLTTGTAANSDMEARIKALEDQQTDTRDMVDAMNQLYIRLRESVNHLEYQNTLQRVRPQTPGAPSADSHAPAVDGSSYVPSQGNLSDDEFSYMLKMFAGKTITADHWDNVVWSFYGQNAANAHDQDQGRNQNPFTDEYKNEATDKGQDGDKDVDNDDP